MSWTISLSLRSDTTFARGDGLVGVVDQEIEHDPATGLPFVRGRTIKGLLVEECANLLYALEQQQSPALERWRSAAGALFGVPGSMLNDGGLHISDGRMPTGFRNEVRFQVEQGRLAAEEVLGGLTEIRRQTSIGANGAPEEGSLRASRVLLRETELLAEVAGLSDDAAAEDHQDQVALLAVCLTTLRRAGLGRNRGRGKLTCRLLQDRVDQTTSGVQRFAESLHAAGGPA